MISASLRRNFSTLCLCALLGVSTIAKAQQVPSHDNLVVDHDKTAPSVDVLASTAMGERPLALSAEDFYAEYQNSAMQIRIIDIQADGQNSMGSGFFVADGSLIATNYHVVSSAVMAGEDHKVEMEYQGEKYTLTLLAIDVVNDLAVLESPVQGVPLSISAEKPKNGTRLFSIGNPYDIGKSLVEGNYNGLVDDRFFDKIHFSGAINAGMSGGPTLNSHGEVVGINVASAGNQVGFLVPAAFLLALLEKVELQHREPMVFFAHMTQQIDDATRYMVDSIVQKTWPQDTLGDAIILGQIHHAMECSGSSDENEDTGFKTISKICSNRDNIYIGHSLNSAYIEYEFYYFEAPSWSPASFYRTLTRETSYARPGNRAGKKDIDNYRCQSSNVTSTDAKITRKISYCVRPYKKLKGLYDTLYMSTSIDQTNKAISSHFTLAGVSQDTAQRFLQKFISQEAWQ